MKKDNKYKLAVFEDEDKADLVEYSKQMQKSIEKALDENQGEKGEKGDKGDKGDKGELVDLIKEEEGKNISIESANLPAIEVSIEGESQQATRTGKNSLDNTATTKISNGITFTVNSDKTVLADGTNDTSANSSLVINRYDLSPGTYILNGCPSGGASNTYRLAIQETGSYSILGSIDIGNGSGEFTIDTTTNVQIAIFIQKGLTVNNLLFKPMLRKATIADDTYEQYGASPSPKYPSPIKNVERRNKFNYLWFDTTKEVDWTAYQSTTSLAKAIPIFIGKGKAATFSSNVPLLSSDNLLFAINDLTNTSSVSFALRKTQTIKANNEGYVYVGYLKSRTNYDKVKDGTYYVQVEEGTVATDYVPYNSLEIKDVGKNLFNPSNAKDGYVSDRDGQILGVNIKNKNTGYIKIDGGEKYFILSNKLTGNWGAWYDKDKKFISGITLGGKNKGIVTAPNYAYFIDFTVSYGNNNPDYANNVMIARSDKEIPYKPYQEQKETFPLGNQKLMKGSYLADNKMHHKRKQIVLDGSDDEGWSILNSKKNVYKLANFINGNGADNSINYPILSNYFKSDNQANVFEGAKNTIQALGGNVNALYISFGEDSDINSISLLRTFLKAKYDASTPVIVEYELSEEEIVPYTETQKEAWEKIKNMILYKGTNNISCTGKLKIKYYTNEEMNEIYAKKEDLHEHANKSILDQTQEAFTTELKNKLDGLNNYVLPAPTSTTLGGVKAGSNITIDADGTINAQLGSGGETSANNYEDLSNKPQIAGITLQGNKSLADLGIQGIETGKGLSSNDYSTTEKAKLAGVEAQANKYIHPTTSGNKHVPSGGSTGQILKWLADGTAVWGADHTVATTSTDGLMSKTDKTKLNNIAEGANKYVHPTTSGNKHIPSGGSSGQVLKWQSDGTAKWGSLSSSGELGTDNLNTKKISGIYAQSTATNFLKARNYPFDHADGFPFFDILLEVKNAGMYIMQELHLSYKISVQGQEVISYFTYMRFSTNNGSTWSAWRGHEGTTTQ